MPEPDRVDSLVSRALAREGSFTVSDVKALLRACFKAPPGYVLLDADLNAIEPRTLAWASGDWEALKAFESGDPYLDAASQIFNRPRGEFKKSSPERQLGKAQVIGCFAADTPVLTRSGFKPILDVTKEDQLWDGNEWIYSDGCVKRGRRPTLDLAGVKVTAEHMVLCEDQWLEAGLLQRDEGTLCRSLATASTSLPLPGTLLENAAGSWRSLFSAIAAGLNTPCSTTIYEKVGLERVSSAQRKKVNTGRNITGGMPISSPTTRTGPDFSTAYPPSSTAAETQKARITQTTAAVGFECTSLGSRIDETSCDTCSLSLGGTSLSSTLTVQITPGGTSREIFDLYPAERISETDGPCRTYNDGCLSLRPVYDIANAGPRNRFTIWTDLGPLIVHNCGYGLGNPEKFRALAAKPPYNVDWDTCPVTPEEVIGSYREAHPQVVRLWADMQSAAVAACDGYTTAVGNPEAPYVWGPSPLAPGRDVWLMLPSGRPIVYYRMSYTHGRRGPEITFQGRRGFTKVYGGLFVENATQALDRDILGVGIVRCETGWDGGEPIPVVLHAHDAIIGLSRREEADVNLGRMMAMMTATPEFTPGLSLKAEGFWSERHRK